MLTSVLRDVKWLYTGGYRITSIHRVIGEWCFDEVRTLQGPMCFLTGPRQVGKTFLEKTLSASYFNFDTVEVKKALLADPYFFRGSGDLVVLDEIHKRRDWTKLLKGYYDSPERRENFIVTGSGRFDFFRKSGDSLQGRYLVNQLWPLSYDEVCNHRPKLVAPRNFTQWEPSTTAENDDVLLRLGGFPQPFLRGSEQFMRRWQEQYRDRLVKEDVRDFANIQRVDQLELLTRILPERLCSPLSIKGLAEDVEVSPVAIKSWLRLLEQLYFGFLVAPYHRKLQRAVKREKKWYFYQWTYAQDEAARLENYMAVQLALACSAWSEQGFGKWELYYLRDQDRREVDFLIAKDLKPVALVEVKSSSPEPTSALRYYSHKLNVPGFLITRDGGPRKYETNIWSMGSRYFLKGLH